MVAAAAGRAAVGLAAADEGKGEREELGMGTGGCAVANLFLSFFSTKGTFLSRTVADVDIASARS